MQIATATSVNGVAFLARLMRLLHEVEELNRRLERIESEIQGALNDFARERIEE